MEFGGKYLVAAPRLKVWEALNDTEILRATIPGCRRIDWTSETALEIEIEVNLGLMQFHRHLDAALPATFFHVIDG